jgi:hypothetical protein
MTFYERNRALCIARQTEYYKKNRERYLEYMREYNRQYWLKNKPPPKPKKEKPPKKVRVPKVPKEKKIKEKLPMKDEWFVVKEPEYPMKKEKGNFVLAFD